MAITGYYTESSLGKSEIYNEWKKGIGDPIEKTKSLIRSSKVLNAEDIEESYIRIRQYSNSLSRAALKAFDVGSTILLYNETKSLSMSQAFPFITGRRGDKWVTYIFMDNHIKITRDGGFNINSTVLHDLLVSALISTKLKTNYDSLTSNQYLQKIFMDIYCKFVCRILNRAYSINVDKILSDSIQYYINRFFLEIMFEATDTEENIETAAIKHFRFVDEMKYEDIKMKYNDANINTFSALLDLIKTESPRMEGLSLKSFIDKWISYYYTPSILAIDNIEYLIFMILTIKQGSNMISIAASDIIKETKHINALETELIKLID